MSGRTDWSSGFIAVDWGTTNRRAYRVVAGGECTDEFEDGLGILSVRKDEFHGAVGQVRERLGDLPMLLGGMIGSNRGWIEAPYARCPAGIDDLSAALIWPEEGAAIVPGVAVDEGRADVMRGEEVQLLGAVAAGDIPADCLVCHPGTHNKWVDMEGGRITAFRTVMTGELFNLLRDRSILSDLLASEATAGDAFGRGVERALSGAGITSELFGARADFLLGHLDKSDGASFISGLLIGEDVRTGIAQHAPADVIVMGRPELTSLYRAALAQAGVQASEIDGEGAFIAGARAIVERIG